MIFSSMAHSFCGLRISPTFALILDLSIVIICSQRTVEFTMTPQSSGVSITCVSFIFLFFDVNGQTIVVGEYLLPLSFCITTTGRTPPCSEPTRSLKSTRYIPPLNTFISALSFFLINLLSFFHLFKYLLLASQKNRPPWICRHQ